MSELLSASGAMARVVRGILEPLCEETAELIAPLEALQEGDTFEVSIDPADSDYFIIQVFKPGPDNMKLAASWHAMASCTRFPEGQKLDSFGGEWRVAATDISALIMDGSWPKERVSFTPEARLTYDRLLLLYMHQTLASQQRARFHLEGVTPDEPEGWIDHPDHPLEPYQKAPAITSIGQDGFGAFMDKGTGKTAVFINRAMNEASEMRRTDPTSMCYILVVCPKAVRMNWQREVERFATIGRNWR